MSYPLLDLYAVMQNVPTIMGLDLKYYKDAWQGAYYMNGERHAYKKDKLKVKLWRGSRGCSIFVHEQGNGSMSLQTWLTVYGGAADYKEAYDIMRGNAIPKAELLGDIRRSSSETRYVTKEEYEEYRQYELERCPLFTSFCRWFGEQTARSVWNKYGVTADHFGNCVYWYIDADGNICYDKVIQYGYDGRRSKTFGGTRRFTTSKGYTSRPLYGSQLIPDEGDVYVCEGEKSALACSCVWPDKCFTATGGKGNLRDLDERFVLLPDFDAVDEWQQKAGKARVFEWWNGHNVGEKDDIADLVLAMVKRGFNVEEIRKILP